MRIRLLLALPLLAATAGCEILPPTSGGHLAPEPARTSRTCAPWSLDPARAVRGIGAPGARAPPPPAPSTGCGPTGKPLPDTGMAPRSSPSPAARQGGELMPDQAVPDAAEDTQHRPDRQPPGLPSSPMPRARRRCAAACRTPAAGRRAPPRRCHPRPRRAGARCRRPGRCWWMSPAIDNPLGALEDLAAVCSPMCGCW